MIGTNNDIKRGVLYALATALVSSIALAAGKMITGILNAPMIVFVQYGFCLLLLFPYVFRQTGANYAGRVWQTQHLGAHLVRGLGGWLSFFALYKALATIPLVDGSLLKNTAPLFVPLVVWLWVGIGVPAKRWFALILGFIGVGLVLRSQTQGFVINTGYWWGLASGAFLTVSMVGTRVLSKTESSATIMFYYFALSTLFSLPMAVFYWQPISPVSWPYLLCLSVSMFVGMWLYTKAYCYAKPSIISPISYFSVVFSGLIGWVVWGYIPSLLAFIGMLVVVVAGVMAVYINGHEQEILTK